MPRALRIGFLNLMPRAETYEPSVRRLLEGRSVPAAMVPVRALTHAYRSSDQEHLRRNYVGFDEAMRAGLDGLVVTGAPLGKMEFEEITYWAELEAIFRRCASEVPATLGLCWGGVAVGRFLGLRKTLFDRKLFGVFRSRWLAPGHWSADPAGEEFDCPQSRYASLEQRGLERAAEEGRLRLLASSAEAGCFVFETADGRFAAHLGHPEYDAGRILFEYRRDRELGLVPANFDPAAPLDTWRAASEGFFDRWLGMVGARAGVLG